MRKRAHHLPLESELKVISNISSSTGVRASPKYSICITHRNNRQPLKRSLESILNQIDERFEVVIVDSISSDGSLDILKQYSRMGVIKLMSERCTRGRGRQLAFDHSKGQYVLSNFDMDDTFFPVIGRLLNIYHRRFEGMMVRIVSPRKIGRWGGSFANTIAPVELVKRLGGWTDVQFGEDIDLWCRAAMEGKYGWLEFDLIESTFAHAESSSFWKKLITKWRINRDFRKLGLTINADTMTSRVLKIASSISYPARNSTKFRRDFSSFNSSYYHLSERYRLYPETGPERDNNQLYHDSQSENGAVHGS